MINFANLCEFWMNEVLTTQTKKWKLIQGFLSLVGVVWYFHCQFAWMSEGFNSFSSCSVFSNTPTIFLMPNVLWFTCSFLVTNGIRKWKSMHMMNGKLLSLILINKAKQKVLLLKRHFILFFSSLQSHHNISSPFSWPI